MRRVLVLGNATVDVILEVPRLPSPGQTVMASRILRCAGGKGLNQAVASSRFGAPTRLVAPVGEDADGDFLRQSLAAESQLALGLLTAPCPTDLSQIWIASGGENMIASTAESARWLSAEKAEEIASTLTAGDLLVLQGNLSPEATEAALRAGRRREATTLFNTAPIAFDPSPLLPLIHVIVANAGEARDLTGAAGEDAAQVLAARTGGTAIVTRGASPAVLVRGRDAELFPITPVDVVDTSGAGDVTVGVFAASLASGRNLRDSLRIALAAASISVTRRGTTPSFPMASELAAIDVPSASRAPVSSHA